MPIYEYECQACGHRTEALQSLSDEHHTECEECGGELKRLVSAPAVQFKGTGWYVTDYGGRKGDDSSSSEGSKEGSEKSSETKKTAAASGTGGTADGTP